MKKTTKISGVYGPLPWLMEFDKLPHHYPKLIPNSNKVVSCVERKAVLQFITKMRKEEAFNKYRTKEGRLWAKFYSIVMNKYINNIGQ